MPVLLYGDASKYNKGTDEAEVVSYSGKAAAGQGKLNTPEGSTCIAVSGSP